MSKKELKVEKRGRAYAASCPKCKYEFIAATAAQVEYEVGQHEMECSDEDGDWQRYQIDGEPSPPQKPASKSTPTN